MNGSEASAQIDLAQEPRFALGGLEVRPAMRELVAGGQAEVLEPRVMQVLVALARRRGEVVSRDDLIQACWGGRAVGEDAINRCTQAIRRLAEAHGGFAVTTIPRVGYRLDESSLPFAKPPQPTLAVLAFDNLSGDPDMAWFSDGMSEEILQTVALGADLKVIGRGSSFQFRGPDKAAKNVAARLNVTHILDGSVRRSGSRVRITAQLVECATEVSLWSDRFDHDLTDIFALQDDIANAVARGLKVAFAPSATPSAIDPDIYDLYLRAISIWGGTFQAAPRAESLGMLEQVVAAAPDFARAWAIVAIARAETRRLQFASIATAAPEKPISAASVRAAADTALRLDPDLGLAHVAHSMLEPWGCYAAQDARCREALTVSPYEAGVLSHWSNYCSWVGRMREALDAAKRALDLDPISWMAALIHAAAAGWVERDAEAYRLWDDLLARWSDIEGYEGATLHAAVIGDWPRVDRLFAKARDLNVAPQRVEAMAALLHALQSSDNAFATNLLNRTRERLAERGVVLLDIPVVLYRLGLRDEAYQLIDEASFDHMFDPEGHPPATRFPSIIFQPLAASLRSDPRFVGFCAKIGLVDYWITTNNWPDCADDGVLPYDFKAECRRLAGAAA